MVAVGGWKCVGGSEISRNAGRVMGALVPSFHHRRRSVLNFLRRSIKTVKWEL